MCLPKKAPEYGLNRLQWPVYGLIYPCNYTYYTRKKGAKQGAISKNSYLLCLAVLLKNNAFFCVFFAEFACITLAAVGRLLCRLARPG